MKEARLQVVGNNEVTATRSRGEAQIQKDVKMKDDPNICMKTGFEG
jgi:hypothetical protein